MDDEISWKQALHASWTTPEQLIDGLVLRATGSAVATRTRIIGGEGNEVWSVATPAGDELIVRVSHIASFAAERWATEHALRAGAVVPHILLVDDAVAAGDKTVAVWIHRTIRGQPLTDVTDEPAARRLTAEAGEQLARIHAVATQGYGWLDADGHGPFADFSAALAWDEQAAEAALANGISRADVDAAAQLLRAYHQVWTPPRLLHGDWLPEHVLTHNGSVAGIIDFGGARSGDPAYDFAYWQFFWDSERFAESSMIEGYRRASDPGPLLDLRVQLCRLSISMRLTSIYAHNGREFPARHSARRFNEALTALRRHITTANTEIP